MTPAQKHLTNAITVLSSRKAALEEELADAKRQKTAPEKEVKKRIAALEAQIVDRQKRLGGSNPKAAPPA